MIFNSIEFVIFLPLFFAGYWLLRKNLRWQNLFVLSASYVFYGWWDWRFLAFSDQTHFNQRGATLFSLRIKEDFGL